MKWINFLHFYQPLNQYPEILNAVVSQSYRPILAAINNNSATKTTLNVSGALLEALDNNGITDVIDMLKTAYNNGCLELTSTSKYHSFLPLMPSEEIIRQVRSNNDCLRFYLGKELKLDGFFPPEMAFSPELVPILNEFGFKWIMLDEISTLEKDFKEFPGNYIPKIKGTNTYVLLRNRRFSNLIMSALVRSPEELVRILSTESPERKYIVTGMDGETFGHHRPGLVPVLESILNNSTHPVVFASELLSSNDLPIEEFTPRACTWASSPQDIENGVQFLSWKDPQNKIHTLQWELLHLAEKAVGQMEKDTPKYETARQLLDVALASDHFWWASAKPWWGLEMIEDGAFRLYEVISSFNDVGSPLEVAAKNLYYKIISTAFEWQRKGIIRERREEEFKTKIPFIDRTLEKGGEHIGVYEAFMSIMSDNELTCAKNREYEQAIMWRDAQEKIKTKNDIYEAVHAVDLIRQKMPFDIVEKILDKYSEKYKKIRGGQPEQRG